MAKHTPGPWRLAGITGSRKRSLGSSVTNREIAQLRAWDDQDLADANLIAAAPELLEALKAVWPIINTSRHQSERELVRAAIAKAEGRV